MKLALFDEHGSVLFTVYQVAAMRIISATAFLLPVIFRNWSKVAGKLFGYIFLSGIAGTLLPALLFCYAETKIDSALAGTLNSMTPVFTLLISVAFLKAKVSTYQVIGIVIGLCGVLLLFASGGGPEQNKIVYSGLIILATIFYAINIIIVSRHLKGLGSLTVVAFSLLSVALPSLVILGLSGFYTLPFVQERYSLGLVAAGTLGVLSTAVAWIIFYELAKRTNIIFASSASYGIPFIALAWGGWYGETISLIKIGCLMIMLIGIFLIRIKPANSKSDLLSRSLSE